MRKLLKAVLVVLLIGLASVVGLAAYFYFVIFGNADRTLARNLQVTSEWTEIKIDPPVRPSYHYQAIYLRPVNYVIDRYAIGFDIRLPDGTVVRPEVELYDYSGEVVELHQKGFTMGHEGADYADFSPANKLPAGRTYAKLRVRSDVPFVCERIEWIDYSPP